MDEFKNGGRLILRIVLSIRYWLHIRREIRLILGMNLALQRLKDIFVPRVSRLNRLIREQKLIPLWEITIPGVVITRLRSVVLRHIVNCRLLKLLEKSLIPFMAMGQVIWIRSLRRRVLRLVVAFHRCRLSFRIFVGVRSRDRIGLSIVVRNVQMGKNLYIREKIMNIRRLILRNIRKVTLILIILLMAIVILNRIRRRVALFVLLLLVIGQIIPCMLLPMVRILLPRTPRRER